MPSRARGAHRAPRTRRGIRPCAPGVRARRAIPVADRDHSVGDPRVEPVERARIDAEPQAAGDDDGHQQDQPGPARGTDLLGQRRGCARRPTPSVAGDSPVGRMVHHLATLNHASLRDGSSHDQPDAMLVAHSLGLRTRSVEGGSRGLGGAGTETVAGRGTRSAAFSDEVMPRSPRTRSAASLSARPMARASASAPRGVLVSQTVSDDRR